MAQMIQHLSEVQETWVQFLGWEAPLEKEMTTHSSILAWRILWTEEPGRLQLMGWQESDTTWCYLSFLLSVLSHIQSMRNVVPLFSSSCLLYASFTTL